MKNKTNLQHIFIGLMFVCRRSGAVLCASLLLMFFCWTGWQSVKADTSIGNVPAGGGQFW